jgi:hypothetical protein
MLIAATPTAVRPVRRQSPWCLTPLNRSVPTRAVNLARGSLLISITRINTVVVVRIAVMCTPAIRQNQLFQTPVAAYVAD